MDSDDQKSPHISCKCRSASTSKLVNYCKLGSTSTQRRLYQFSSSVLKLSRVFNGKLERVVASLIRCLEFGKCTLKVLALDSAFKGLTGE
jgi:hypothetical protein